MPRLTYSRYFDDISISGSSRAHSVIDMIKEIVESEGYKIHESGDKIKKYFPQDTKIITGINISKDGELSVAGISKLGKDINDLSVNGIKLLSTNNIQKERQILYGKVAFIKQVNLTLAMKLRAQLDSVDWGVTE
jgi:hypothetical protein